MRSEKQESSGRVESGDHAEMIRQGDIAHDDAMSQATRDMAARLAARIATRNLERLYGA